MKKKFSTQKSVCFGLFLLLTSCAQQPPVVETTPPPKVLKPDHDAIAAIRSASGKSDSAVEVQPLRDPAVEGWLKQANELEMQGKYTEALAATQRALTLATGAPDILQYQAEIQFQRQRYEESAMLAQKSYENGPKVGSLCARNWQTLVEVRSLFNDARGKEQAQKQLASCKVAPPVRM